jgi:anti-anti-sigma regulatory factor
MNTIAVDLFDELLVVTLRGAWDWSSAERLCRFLETLKLERDVMVDLRYTNCFDSATLSALIRFRQRAEDRGRRMEIVSSPFVASVLVACRLESLGAEERDCADRIRSAGKPIARVKYWVEAGT